MAGDQNDEGTFMIHVEHKPLETLLIIGQMKDARLRNQALKDWYAHHVKELTWFFDSNNDEFNPFSFKEMAYQMLVSKMCETLFQHPNVNIRTKFYPHLGRVRINASVGLVRLQDPVPSLDRNEAEGLNLPPALLE